MNSLCGFLRLVLSWKDACGVMALGGLRSCFKAPIGYGKVGVVLWEQLSVFWAAGSAPAMGCPEAKLLFSTYINEHCKPLLRSASWTSLSLVCKAILLSTDRAGGVRIYKGSTRQRHVTALYCFSKIQGVSRFNPRSSSTDSGKRGQFSRQRPGLPVPCQEPWCQLQVNKSAVASRETNKSDKRYRTPTNPSMNRSFSLTAIDGIFWTINRDNTPTESLTSIIFIVFHMSMAPISMSWFYPLTPSVCCLGIRYLKPFLYMDNTDTEGSTETNWIFVTCNYLV